jgi:hypothetical protein
MTRGGVDRISLELGIIMELAWEIPRFQTKPGELKSPIKIDLKFCISKWFSKKRK